MQTGAGGMYSIFTGDVPETSYWFAMTLDQGSAINLISPHYLSN
jgi:hypothetical protein